MTRSARLFTNVCMIHIMEQVEVFMPRFQPKDFDDGYVIQKM